MEKYKYQWRYYEHERKYDQYCKCYDCGLDYTNFQDMVLPDEIWEKINPTFIKGSGLLCPTCISNRLNYIGEWYKKGFYNFNFKN